MANPIERIGQIPEDWSVEKANQHLILESGMRPAEFVTDHPSDIPSLGGENIDLSGNLVFDNIRYISKEYYSRMPKGKVQDEDILINKDGANTGKIAFAKAKPFVECAVNEHVFLIRNRGAFDQEYLFYFLYSDKGSRQIQRKIVGSAQGGINNSFTKGLLIPKPPKNEQKAIATILCKVDEAIKATENSIRAAEKLKKSLMQNLLTGKLKPDGTWRKEDDFYKDEKFGNVPLGWEVARVKDFGFIQTGKTPPTAEPDLFATGTEVEDSFMFITPGDLGDCKYIVSSERYVTAKGLGYSFKLPINSVCLVCIGSTIGKIGISTKEACTNQQINTIIPNDYNSSEFFYYMMLFRSTHFKEIAGINATPQINKSGLSKYKLLRPISLIEQTGIARLLAESDKEILKKEAKVKTLQRLKKSLMQNLLTGKVRVDLGKIEKLIANEAI